MKYFALTEFDCSCCRRNEMDAVFLQELDDLRARYGKPLIVSSGYRCPTHNQRVSSTGATGPHTTGRAADLRVSRADARRLVGIAIDMGFTGIGVQQKGGVRFVHVDNLPNAEGQPRPTIWTY